MTLKVVRPAEATLGARHLYGRRFDQPGGGQAAPPGKRLTTRATGTLWKQRKRSGTECASIGMLPIPMDDGVVLRADIFRPTGDGRYPVILSYGPYAKGLCVPGRLQGPLGSAREGRAGGAGRLQQQVPELGAGRSGEMGAGRLCLPAHQLARRRPLARLSRRVVASARRRTSINASNGPARSPGATARSASTAFPITQ